MNNITDLVRAITGLPDYQEKVDEAVCVCATEGSEDIDDAEAFASRINNEGIYGQVEYLLDNNGHDIAAVLAAVRGS